MRVVINEGGYWMGDYWGGWLLRRVLMIVQSKLSQVLYHYKFVHLIKSLSWGCLYHLDVWIDLQNNQADCMLCSPGQWKRLVYFFQVDICCSTTKSFKQNTSLLNWTISKSLFQWLLQVSHPNTISSLQTGWHFLVEVCHQKYEPTIQCLAIVYPTSYSSMNINLVALSYPLSTGLLPSLSILQCLGNTPENLQLCNVAPWNVTHSCLGRWGRCW